MCIMHPCYKTYFQWLAANSLMYSEQPTITTEIKPIKQIEIFLFHRLSFILDVVIKCLYAIFASHYYLLSFHWKNNIFFILMLKSNVCYIYHDIFIIMLSHVHFYVWRRAHYTVPEGLKSNNPCYCMQDIILSDCS